MGKIYPRGDSMYKVKWPMKFPSRIKKALPWLGLNKIHFGKSFYLVAVLCIIAITVTSVWVFRQGQNSIEQKVEYETHEEMITEENTAEKVVLEKEHLDEVVELDTDKPKEPRQPEPQLKPAVNQVNLNTMIQPVLGKVYKEHSINKLAYSKTLEQWQIHPGIDILAEENTTVKAALSGVVEQVVIDSKLGVMVIIDHGNEIKTKYANLAVNPPVAPGQRVKKGDVIGKIGRTANFECEDPPHLHFELIQQEKSIDPNLYLPKIQ